MICLMNTPTSGFNWFKIYFTIKKCLLLWLVTFKINAIIITVYCLNLLPWTSNRSSHWKLFVEINLYQKTLKLYTSLCALKEPGQIDYKKIKVCYGMSMNSSIQLIYLLNHFMETGLFPHSLKYIRKSEVSGGKEKDQCHETSYESFSLQFLVLLLI